MYTIRIAIGNLGSTEQLIQSLWTELQATPEAVSNQMKMLQILARQRMLGAE